MINCFIKQRNSIEGGVKLNPTSSSDASSHFLLNLQSLRALAFFSVMFHHTGISFLNSVGRWGVSVFFILSGFVMVYSYYNKNRIQISSVSESVCFAFKKLKRLYLLHILCTLAMMLFCFIGDKTSSYINVAVKFFLNAFYIQEWVPLDDRSPNTVSWFLCTILLGYTIFPLFLRILENHYSNSKALLCIILAVLVQFLLSYAGSDFPVKEKVENSIWDYELTEWFDYFFPLSRIWDIIIGFNLGYLFVNRKGDFSAKTVSVMEVAGIVMTLLACYLCHKLTPELNITTDAVVLSHPERWWTYSLIFIPGSILLIYAFAMQSGYLSKLLTNRFTLYLAKISPYGFLIHYVVFRYLAVIYFRIHGYENGEFLLKYGILCNLTLGIGISIVCSEIWMRLYDRFIKSRNFRFI